VSTSHKRRCAHSGAGSNISSGILGIDVEGDARAGPGVCSRERNKASWDLRAASSNTIVVPSDKELSKRGTIDNYLIWKHEG